MFKPTKLGALALVAIFGIACSDGPTDPAGELPSPDLAVTTNIDVPLGPVVNPCNGDVITFPGARLHVKFSTTVDANGGLHTTFHFQPKNARGVGAPSGISYNGTGITRGNTNFPSGGGFNDTFVNNFRMIAAANGPSFQVHQTMHITINANGDLTALVNSTRTTCG